MTQVIKQYGRPMESRDLDGNRIVREEQLFMDTDNQWYKTLEYDSHFIYKTKKIGTSFMCTCGSAGALFGYEAYKQYASRYMGSFVLGCINHLQYQVHADGSH